MDIGANGTVLLSDGTLPYWGSVPASSNAQTTEKVRVDAAITSTQYYLVLSNTVSDYTTVTSDISFAFDAAVQALTVPNVNITSTTASTSTVSNQALVVSGGIATLGSIRSPEGQVDENYLLYTPRVTVSTSTPVNPRIGDFWINPTGPYFLQYVRDGASRVWIQI